MMNLRVLILIAQLLLAAGIDFPEPVVHSSDCPVGPGVHRGHITATTIATCKCGVKNNDSGYYTAQARWFTRQGTVVGTENRLDHSSTLAVWFNASDPDQMYECRVISSVSSYTTVRYTPLFSYPSCYMILEKGQSAHLQYTASRNISSLTWQVFSGNVHGYVSLTTCSPNLLCRDLMPSRYLGHAVSSTVTTYTSQLSISDAAINESNFRCLSSERKILGICTFEVFVWPTQPVCQPVTVDSTNNFIEVTCTVSNVFPRIRASIISSLQNPTHSLPDGNNSVCNVSSVGTGLYGDVSETCTWRFPVAGKRPGVYQYYFQVKADLSDYTTVERAAAQSQIVTFKMQLPVAVIYNCPMGPGVSNGKIRTGTSATCRCSLDPVGFPPGQARWFTPSGQIAGQEDPRDGSSTLTVEYQSSVVRQTYECRPVTTLPGPVQGVTFIPSFTSSAPGSVLKPQSRLLLLAAVIFTPMVSGYLVINSGRVVF